MAPLFHFLIRQDSSVAHLQKTIDFVASAYPDCPITIFANLSQSEKSTLESRFHTPPSFFSPSVSNYNRAVANPPPTCFLVFLDSSAIFESAIFEQLAAELSASPQLAGINPVFVDPVQNCIFEAGLFFDEISCIHALYRGVQPDLPFIGKTRLMQTANPAFLILHPRAYLEGGGLQQKNDLPFQMLFLRISAQGKYFASAGRVKVLHANKWKWLENAGLWNSWAMRGKLAPDFIKPDYAGQIISSNLPLGITQWLEEIPGNLPVVNDPWYLWQADPKPSTLLHWLGSLPQQDIGRTLSKVREWPCWLPMQFAWYQYLATRRLAFARENHLDSLEHEVLQWQKRSRIFHYKYLIGGMEALARARIYKTDLSRCPGQYDAWLELQAPRPSPPLIAGPKIAIVMPVYNPDLAYFEAAINSILKQTYANWELCIADDCSPNSEAWTYMTDLAKKDCRLKCVRRQKNGMISRATNTALELVTAPWVAFMDQDDLLASTALQELAAAIGANPGALMFCSDEDCITPQGTRRSPNFRTLPAMYPGGHLFAYQTALVREAGGCDPACDGAQDTELNLRILRKIRPGQFAHIPRILYHWRIHEGSTAGTIASKPYVRKAFAAALATDASLRLGTVCTVPDNRQPFRITCEFPPHTKAAVILHGAGHMDASMRAILASLKDHVPLQVHDGTLPPQEATPAPDGDIFAYAKTLDADIICFLSTALRPTGECDLAQILALASSRTVSTVGGILWHEGRLVNGGWYPDETGMPFALHAGSGKELTGQLGYGEMKQIHCVLGVPMDCMAIRKEALLKAHISGYWAALDLAMQHFPELIALVSPACQWEYASAPPVSTAKENAALFAKWGAKMATLPLRNANIFRSPDQGWMLDLAR